MHELTFSELLLALVAIVLATKLLGELAQRIGQPAVLGELIAGVLLGGSVLGIVDPHNATIEAFAEIGVLVLLFEIGLHTDLRSLVRVGSAATTVGIVGVALPFLAGYFVAGFFGLPMVPAIVAGAALTATSIGISARVLSDLGALQTREGQVVLGAAVLDDVVGLIILSVVSALAGGAAVSVAGVGKITAVAIGFIVIALLLGRLLVPPIFVVVERIKTSGTLGLVALAFAFLLAWLAEAAGSAMIIGAFAAGLVLHDTPQRHEIERAVTGLGLFFVPIFFAVVGAKVELSALADLRALAIGGALIAVAILGKYLAGYAPFWFTGNKNLIGVAMIPRGEVGLIFAQMGLATGALDAELFGALMLMVIVTTLLAPVLLGRILRAGAEDTEDQPGDGGIDDLVAGTSLHDERAHPPDPAARRRAESDAPR